MIDSVSFVERLSITKPLPLKLANLLMEGIRLNRFDPQETFLSPGNYPAAIYFVQSGIIRGAIENNDEKTTTWFKQEGDLIIPQGLFNQRQSEEYITAVMHTTLLALPVKHIQKLAASYPEIMELIILLLAEKNHESHYREKLLRISAAQHRYQFILANESFILKRVPHYLIASYINVSKETFSRLNKGLAY